MAILDEVPGLKVTVQIADQDCTEYNADEDGHPNSNESCPSITKYIECIDDAEFAIKIKTNNRYKWGYKNHSLGCFICIDGQNINGTLLSTRYLESIVDKHKYVCRETRQWVVSKLKFSPVNIVDKSSKDCVTQSLDPAQNTGLITTTIYRCTEHGSRLATERAEGHSVNQKPLQLDEKSMKGKSISHGMRLVAPEAIKRPKRTTIQYISEDNGPIATFRFLYRSRDALEKSLIMPRGPSSSPSSPVGEFGHLSQDEIQRLAMERFEQLRQNKGRETEIKPALKRETEEEAEQRPSKRPAQFVDLTIE